MPAWKRSVGSSNRLGNAGRRPRVLGAVTSAALLMTLAAGCTGSKPNGPTGPHTAHGTPTSTASPTVSGPKKSAGAPPARKKPVRAPGGGTIKQRVHPHTQPTSKPISIANVSRSRGVTVAIASVKSIRAKAIGPGEIAGAGIVVQVRVTNKSSDPVDLNSSWVNVLDSYGSPAIALTSDPYRPLTGRLAPNKSRAGFYVFNIAKKDRRSISILVTYSASAPTAHFKGTVK